MTAFKDTFLGKKLHQLEDFFNHERAVAISILEPSIEAFAEVIKKEGPEVVREIVKAMAIAAGASLASGLGKQNAGHAALNAIITTGENVAITAIEKLGQDVAHAVAVATVTESAI